MIFDRLSSRLLWALAAVGPSMAFARHAPPEPLEVFNAHRTELSAPGLHEIDRWWFSCVSCSNDEAASMAPFLLRSSLRSRANQQFTESLLDDRTLPAFLSPSARVWVRKLAFFAAGSPFDLREVQEVESANKDGGVTLVMALPARTVAKISYSQVIDWLRRQVSADSPTQDPLLLLELSESTAEVATVVREAMAKSLGLEAARLFPPREMKWVSCPDWIRNEPRQAIVDDSEQVTASQLLGLLAKRPEDISIRRQLQVRFRESGFDRSAELFDGGDGLKWSVKIVQPDVLREVPELANSCGLDSGWIIELNLNTDGAIPWADKAAASLGPNVRRNFDMGNLREAGRMCIETLERSSCPEALSYLSAICCERRLHRLGAALGAIAAQADPRLPYPGVNRLRNLMALGDRHSIEQEIDKVAASSSLDAWGKDQIRLVRSWLASRK